MVECLQRFPYRLLLLAKSPDQEACAVRQQVAREILETAAHRLEVSTRKVKTTFEEELKTAEVDGILTGRLRVSIRGIARTWEADSGECERVNKLLNLLTERCPGISYELQSSRAAIKHFMGEAGNRGAGNHRRKWSEYKPIASRMMNLCLANWPDRLEVQEDCLRWSPPQFPSDLPNDKEMTNIFDKLVVNPKQTVSRKWAACYNMLLNQKLNSVSAVEKQMRVITFLQRPANESPSSFAYYLVADKVRTSHRFVECLVRNEYDLWLRRPLVFVNSVDVIASYWSSILEGSTVAIIMLKVKPPLSTDTGRQLSFIGVKTEMEPIVMLTKPTKKISGVLKKELDDDYDSDLDSDAGEEETNYVDGNTDANEANENFQQAVDLLRQLGEQNDDNSSETSECENGHGHSRNSAKATSAKHRAVGQVLRETNPSEPDDLELHKNEFEMQAAEEINESAVSGLEWEKVKAALKEGNCPVPTQEQVSDFLAAYPDDLAETALMELVLNHAGHLPNSVNDAEIVV